MARFHLALLLLFVAVSAVIVSAVDKPSTTTAEAPAATTPKGGDGGAGEAPGDENAIGTTDVDDPPGTPGDEEVAVPGPIGSDSSYANYPPPQQTAGSDATATIGFASVAAATVVSFFFL